MISQEIILATTFQCQFDLSLYPFDTQKCKLIIKSTQGKHSVRFIADTAEFLVGSLLTSYLSNAIRTKNKGAIIFFLVHRKFMGTDRVWKIRRKNVRRKHFRRKK